MDKLFCEPDYEAEKASRLTHSRHWKKGNALDSKEELDSPPKPEPTLDFAQLQIETNPKTESPIDQREHFLSKRIEVNSISSNLSLVPPSSANLRKYRGECKTNFALPTYFPPSIIVAKWMGIFKDDEIKIESVFLGKKFQIDSDTIRKRKNRKRTLQ
jgi:hypothetical protein